MRGEGHVTKCSVPWNVAAVLRGSPEAELEDEETENRDGTVAVAGVLGTEKAYINVLG